MNVVGGSFNSDVTSTPEPPTPVGQCTVGDNIMGTLDRMKAGYDYAQAVNSLPPTYDLEQHLNGQTQVISDPVTTQSVGIALDDVARAEAAREAANANPCGLSNLFK